MESATRLESARPPASGLPASAPGRPLEDLVILDRGATCLERDRLIERIARWLQRTSVEAPLRVHVRGDPELPTRVFFSVVREPGDSAERRLDNAPSDCDQLHSAVALSIALAIEATLQHALDGPGPLPDEPVKPAWKRRPVAEPVHLDLALLGGASVGVLTGAALAGAPRLALTPWSWLQIVIAGFATHLDGETIEQVSGKFSATLLAGGLDACFGGETSQGVAFFMCLGGRAGSFETVGEDYNRLSPRVADSYWALVASGQGRFWVSGAIGIGTSVEAMYALKPRDLVWKGEDAPTFRKPVPRLGLTVAIGPVFRFF